MSSTYEASGRVKQKRRTREALISAARDLVASGANPTVEDTAAAASVSRATAYRYFPDQRSLLLAAHPEIAATTLLPDDPPNDVADRLDAVVRAFIALIIDTEAQQRTMLRLSLDPVPAEPAAFPLRQGRGIRWIAEALDPLLPQLGEEGVHRLVLGIRSAIGIEALVWLTDIGGLSREDAAELMLSSARAMLRAAMSA